MLYEVITGKLENTNLEFGFRLTKRFNRNALVQVVNSHGYSKSGLDKD